MNVHTKTRFHRHKTKWNCNSRERLNQNGDNLSAIMSGNGDLNIEKGEVKKQIVAVSNNGDYDGSSVESFETKVRLFENGTVSVWGIQWRLYYITTDVCTIPVTQSNFSVSKLRLVMCLK